MARPARSSSESEATYLVDENEQLRASLESVLEENALLLDERARLRDRMRELGQELRLKQETIGRQDERAAELEPALARQGQTEEELRVTLEELRVVIEELEEVNSGLQQTNQELDERVEQRTLQLREIDENLRTTEASLRAVADLVPELLWRADARGEADWFNQRWMAYTGASSDASLGMRWLNAVHARDRDVTRTLWSIAVAKRESFEHEYRIRDASGAYRWFLVRAEPLRDDNGRVLRFFAAGVDIHDQRLAIEALQRSELRFRTLVEGMPQLVWRAVEGGRWTWCSPQWGEYTGQDEGRAREWGWLEALHPDDRKAARDAWKRAQSSDTLEIESRIFHVKERRHRHFRTRARAVRDPAGRVLEWLGTSTDVDDILQLQEEQGVLVAELQHRTRNLMGVVQAVTARTLSSAPSLAQFDASIKDRLSALARVQGLLSRREIGMRVPFDLLLREELSAHVELSAPAPDGRVQLDGPAGIPLRSATVQMFALALHELATNAVKYGALSDKGGLLKVSWGLTQAETGDPQLWVDWRETGVSDAVPHSAPPRGGGYGRELIERALPYQLGARTTYELTPDGVHCTIAVNVPAEHRRREKVDG